jgi:micrococcal nuclease
MKSIKLSIFVLLSVIIFASPTLAHRGGHDKLGGHFQNSDCTYHFHKPTSLVKNKSKEEIVSLIKKHSSNKCKNSLTTKKVDFSMVQVKNTPSPTTKTTTTSSIFKLNKTYTATLSKCVDGDTANFKVDGKVYKTRFLFIDTPESTNKVEKYGKEASTYTCNQLKNAKKITLETDGKDIYDKYERLLAWVFVDGKLLQEKITKVGYVKGYYDFGDYKYENKVRQAMKYAKENKNGMYAKK